MVELKAQTKDDEASSLEHRFRAGSDAAFDEIMERYSPVVRRLVRRLLAWEPEVEDVVQDVFVKAFVHRLRFRQEASLKTWLYSIALNICRTQNRRRLLWQKLGLQRSNKDMISDADPGLSLAAREKAANVRRAVAQLPVKCRDVIVLKYMEEMETQEIVAILNISEEAYYTRLNRARNQMQTLLAEYADDQDE